jgi:hypothetical protein
MLQNLFRRLSEMVRDVLQRFQKAPGNTATKSTPQRANTKIARANGQRPGHRPKNTPRGRAVKKR